MEMRVQVALLQVARLDVRNVPEEGQPEYALDVILALDRIVEVIDEEGETEPDAQPPG
jgi:Cys-tRNA synthase (O-phospho-L-seryl-tRNA:Cys-tRNA synthase)